jgi:Ca2+-binding EF-hand superfamily protein
MITIVSALYKMLGDLVSLQGEEFDTPVKLVDKIFREMDTDRDGKLSKEEYKIGAQNDPAIVQGLSLF